MTPNPDRYGYMRVTFCMGLPLGNSMAVPVVRWIGERIVAQERRRARG